MDLKVLQRKHTRLEIVSPNEVAAILEYKAKELEEKGLPVEQGLADYIAFGLQNIEDEVEKLKNYKKMIDEKIQEMKEQKTQISEKVAEWFEGNGIDKLRGTYVSSITIKPEKPSEVKKKIVRDISDEDLLKMGLAHYEEYSTKPIPKQVKINKRRSNGAEKSVNGNSTAQLSAN